MARQVHGLADSTVSFHGGQTRILPYLLSDGAGISADRRTYCVRERAEQGNRGAHGLMEALVRSTLV